MQSSLALKFFNKPNCGEFSTSKVNALIDKENSDNESNDNFHKRVFFTFYPNRQITWLKPLPHCSKLP
jgi:hypothetical protein